MLQFGWSLLVLRIPTFAAPLPNLLWSLREYHLQLVSPSASCSVAFSVLWQDLSTFLFFDFYSVVHRNRKVHKSAGSLLSFTLALLFYYHYHYSIFSFTFGFHSIIYPVFIEIPGWEKAGIICILCIYIFCSLFWGLCSVTLTGTLLMRGGVPQRAMNQLTRNWMTMHKALNSRDDR